MSNIAREKVNQAVQILQEKGLDLWLIFVRETSASGDPILPLIYGLDVTWQSAFMITKDGQSIAIVGHFEAEAAKRVGAFDTIIPYHQSIRNELQKALDHLKPGKIGINFSKDDVHADGIGYGLYQVLLDHLENTQFKHRLVSAELISGALRSRKSKEEILRITNAIKITEEIFQKTFEFAEIGMTEKQIGEFMHSEINARGINEAWNIHNCPSVNTGPDSPVGHLGPGDTRIQPGHILHIDFGVKIDGYCSDLQRCAYFLAPGETSLPEKVSSGFNLVRDSVIAAANALRPGVKGKEVDNAARNIIMKGGFDEYMYATGHHLGRTVHDGSGILGPEWDRYGNTPNYLVEAQHVYTIEPGIFVPGHGYIGLEEDVVVTENGMEFLSIPQTSLIIK